MEREKKTWKLLWPTLSRKYKRTATFLNYTNVWELLVAVILSAQMTDEGVNAITPRLFSKYPSPESMAIASVSSIAEMIKNVNYFNTKAKYLKRTAQLIVGHFKGQVPDTIEELMSLSGVGRKTAVAVLANGFGKYIGIPVDTHVIRFAGRFGLSQHTEATAIEQDLLKIIPQKNWNAAGYAIKEYGRKEGRARGYHKENDPLYKIYTKGL